MFYWRPGEKPDIRAVQPKRFETGKMLKSVSVTFVEIIMYQAYELTNQDKARIRWAN